MIKNTRNPSLPTIKSVEPLKVIKPNESQASNQTSDKASEPSSQTYIAEKYPIMSSKDYSKRLMKKYKIVQSLKTTRNRAEFKQDTLFSVLL
jgi:hypothetical protein